MGWLGNGEATIVDLFAGTGGMGLASLLTAELRNRSRIVYAAEVDPEYLTTIRQNYDYYAQNMVTQRSYTFASRANRSCEKNFDQ